MAGVQGNVTFLNAGSAAGLKVGDKFQIVHIVDSDMQDPDTHQPIMRKKQVCLLTISEVEDSLSSGECKGELAQSGDQAIAATHEYASISVPLRMSSFLYVASATPISASKLVDRQREILLRYYLLHQQAEHI